MIKTITPEGKAILEHFSHEDSGRLSENPNLKPFLPPNNTRTQRIMQQHDRLSRGKAILDSDTIISFFGG